MHTSLKGLGLVALSLFILVATSEAQTWPDGGNPGVGATLYDSCVPCHTLSGNGIAGLPVQKLMTKMKTYQSGTFSAPKIIGMQKVLQPMTDAQLLDLAAYITKM
ncbi:MAG: tat pathway signal sequence [Bilophila sp.]